MWIVASAPRRSRADGDGRVAAASLVYDAAGNRVARYDKIHLFDVDIPGKVEKYRESANDCAGVAHGGRGYSGGQSRTVSLL